MLFSCQNSYVVLVWLKKGGLGQIWVTKKSSFPSSYYQGLGINFRIRFGCQKGWVPHSRVSVTQIQDYLVILSLVSSGANKFSNDCILDTNLEQYGVYSCDIESQKIFNPFQILLHNFFWFIGQINKKQILKE